MPAKTKAKTTKVIMVAIRREWPESRKGGMVWDIMSILYATMRPLDMKRFSTGLDKKAYLK